MEFYDFDKDNSINEELIHPRQQIDETLQLKAYTWCKDYLGGLWSKATIHDFHMEYLEGGLTNYLYICELKEDFLSCHSNGNNISHIDEEPKRVLLRLYGEIVEHITKFNEGIIFNVMSERKIGPRLLGAFPAGRIEEFIPTNHLTVHDFRNGNLIDSLAKLIASYHTLKIPLNRNPKIFFKNIPKWLLFMEKHLKCDQNLDNDVSQCYHILKHMNIRYEMEWLQNMLNKVDSPVVFCHNDLQEGNIMFSPIKNHQQSELCLIDYEYSSYHYRGYDLGNHFNEYMFDNFASNSDGFSYDYNCYPSIDRQLQFCRVYLDTCDRLTKHKQSEYRSTILTSPEKLIDESNRYALASHIYWGLWAFVQFKISKIRWGYLKYCMTRFDCYFYFKKLWKF